MVIGSMKTVKRVPVVCIKRSQRQKICFRNVWNYKTQSFYFVCNITDQNCSNDGYWVKIGPSYSPQVYIKLHRKSPPNDTLNTAMFNKTSQEWNFQNFKNSYAWLITRSRAIGWTTQGSFVLPKCMYDFKNLSRQVIMRVEMTADHSIPVTSLRD